MNASMNIHRAQSIEVTPKLFDTFTATEILVTATDGSVVCIDVCADAGPLVIKTRPTAHGRLPQGGGMNYPYSQHAWAERGKWLVDKLTERTTPDGRCVLEISEEPIWIQPGGTLYDYIIAVDLAMSRDESRATP